MASRKRQPKIDLVNKSRWPTPALDVLVKWIVKRAGIDHRYRVEVKSCRVQTWCGRGGRHAQWIKLDRHYRRVGYRLTVAQAERALQQRRDRLAHNLRRLRADGWLQWPERDSGGNFEMLDSIRDAISGATDALADAKIDERHGDRFRKLWPYTVSDSRFSWSASYEYRSRFELLVMLIAHEAYHATDGNPINFQRDDGRINRASMEYRCNKFADETVAALREQWPTLRRKIYDAMRRARDKAKREKTAKAERRSPAYKLQLAESNRDKWLAAKAKAERMVAKYEREIGRRNSQIKAAAKRR